MANYLDDLLDDLEKDNSQPARRPGSATASGSARGILEKKKGGVKSPGDLSGRGVYSGGANTKRDEEDDWGEVENPRDWAFDTRGERKNVEQAGMLLNKKEYIGGRPPRSPDKHTKDDDIDDEFDALLDEINPVEKKATSNSPPKNSQRSGGSGSSGQGTYQTRLDILGDGPPAGRNFSTGMGKSNSQTSMTEEKRKEREKLFNVKGSSRQGSESPVVKDNFDNTYGSGVSQTNPFTITDQRLDTGESHKSGRVHTPTPDQMGRARGGGGIAPSTGSQYSSGTGTGQQLPHAITTGQGFGVGGAGEGGIKPLNIGGSRRGNRKIPQRNDRARTAEPREDRERGERDSGVGMGMQGDKYDIGGMGGGGYQPQGEARRGREKPPLSGGQGQYRPPLVNYHIDDRKEGRDRDHDHHDHHEHPDSVFEDEDVVMPIESTRSRGERPYSQEGPKSSGYLVVEDEEENLNLDFKPSIRQPVRKIEGAAASRPRTTVSDANVVVQGRNAGVAAVPSSAGEKGSERGELSSHHKAGEKKSSNYGMFLPEGEKSAAPMPHGHMSPTSGPPSKSRGHTAEGRELSQFSPRELRQEEKAEKGIYGKPKLTIGGGALQPTPTNAVAREKEEYRDLEVNPGMSRHELAEASRQLSKFKDSMAEVTKENMALRTQLDSYENKEKEGEVRHENELEELKVQADLIKAKYENDLQASDDKHMSEIRKLHEIQKQNEELNDRAKEKMKESFEKTLSMERERLDMINSMNIKTMEETHRSNLDRQKQLFESESQNLKNQLTQQIELNKLANQIQASSTNLDDLAQKITSKANTELQERETRIMQKEIEFVQEKKKLDIDRKLVESDMKRVKEMENMVRNEREGREKDLEEEKYKVQNKIADIDRNHRVNMDQDNKRKDDLILLKKEIQFEREEEEKTRKGWEDEIRIKTNEIKLERKILLQEKEELAKAKELFNSQCIRRGQQHDDKTNELALQEMDLGKRFRHLEEKEGLLKAEHDELALKVDAFCYEKQKFDQEADNVKHMFLKVHAESEVIYKFKSNYEKEKEALDKIRLDMDNRTSALNNEKLKLQELKSELDIRQKTVEALRYSYVKDSELLSKQGVTGVSVRHTIPIPTYAQTSPSKTHHTIHEHTYETMHMSPDGDKYSARGYTQGGGGYRSNFNADEYIRQLNAEYGHDSNKVMEYVAQEKDLLLKSKHDFNEKATFSLISTYGPHVPPNRIDDDPLRGISGYDLSHHFGAPTTKSRGVADYSGMERPANPMMSMPQTETGGQRDKFPTPTQAAHPVSEKVDKMGMHSRSRGQGELDMGKQGQSHSSLDLEASRKYFEGNDVGRGALGEREVVHKTEESFDDGEESGNF